MTTDEKGCFPTTGNNGREATKSVLDIDSNKTIVPLPRAHYPEYRVATGRKELFVSVEKLQSFDYVRETLVTTSNPRQTIGKRKRPYFGEQHAIYGYAVVGKFIPGLFHVIIWWHKHHDRDIQPNGVYSLSEHMRSDPACRDIGPCEAVPPARVLEFFKDITGSV